MPSHTQATLPTDTIQTPAQNEVVLLQKVQPTHRKVDVDFVQGLLEGWLVLGSGFADVHASLQTSLKAANFTGLEPGKLQSAKVVHRHLARALSCMGTCQSLIS